MDHESLRRERLSEQSLRQSVRDAGEGGLEAVAYVVLETSGKLSVIPGGNLGERIGDVRSLRRWELIADPQSPSCLLHLSSSRPSNRSTPAERMAATRATSA